MTEIRKDEYLDPADGLIHCRKCGGPRQAIIPDPFKGGSFKPRCVCPCQQEAERRRREVEERRQRMERIRRRKVQGLQDRYTYQQHDGGDVYHAEIFAVWHSGKARSAQF